MAKKVVYHISGFDCPSCAAESESYLNKDKRFSEVSIDFSNERLYITYKEEELEFEELKELVNKSSDDPVELKQLNSKKEEIKILGKEFFFNVSRILLSFLIALFTKIFVKLEEQPVLAIVLYSVALLICLYDILFKVFKNIVNKKNPVDINLLMSLTSIGVIVLASLILYKAIPSAPFEIDMFDGVLVVVLYQIGELFEDIATAKSKKAIKAAIDLKVEKTSLIKDDKIVEISPESLQIGDKIVVKVGEVIPVDCVIIDGVGTLDTSSLTGESLPLEVWPGVEALSGEIVKSGTFILEVKKALHESTISKIMELIESSGEHKTKTEKFITKFARIYTPSVFVIGLVYALIFGFVSGEWTTGIFGGLAILVVSCPCAIVISVPLAYFAGIGLASKHGIIVKGTNYLDTLCNVGTLYIDKTGTLTYGNFKVHEIKSLCKKEEFLEALYIAESRSNHPLAQAIIKDVDTSKYFSDIKRYDERAGEGVEVQYASNLILAGTAAFLGKNNVKVQHFDGVGTPIYVSKNGEFLGYVVLKDEVREDANELIDNLHKLGIKVVLLSGDKKDNVLDVCSKLKIDECHYELLPQEKTNFILNDKGVCAYAGDGINDAPSIMNADVGFAMGGVGSDVAVENADVVLMQDKPNKIYSAIKIAKKTRLIALINITVSLLVKVTVMVLILAGVLRQFGMVIAVLSDTGLSAILIAHSLSLLYRKVR